MTISLNTTWSPHILLTHFRSDILYRKMRQCDIEGHCAGGALCAPSVIKIDRLVTKSISNVTKLIENSPNTLAKLLVPFLAIFFGSGAC